MSSIVLTSTSNVKISAAKSVFDNIIPTETKSEVSEQPLSRDEIMRGCENRTKYVKEYDVLSLESGLIKNNKYGWVEISYGILKTRYGIFSSWSRSFPIPEKYLDWLRLKEQDKAPTETLGQYIEGEYIANSYINKTKKINVDSSDWYSIVGESRVEILTELCSELAMQFNSYQKQLDSITIKADVKNSRGVKFIDVQTPLLHSPTELAYAPYKLSKGLEYNKVVCISSRGYLFSGAFTQKGIPVVMATKAGKLPGECYEVKYGKEYKDSDSECTLCIEKDSVLPTDKVIIVDDVLATGGSMNAATKLVELSGGKVVSWIVVYAVDVDNKPICYDERVRFLNTVSEACGERDFYHLGVLDDNLKRKNKYNFKYSVISTPSQYNITYSEELVSIEWKKFQYNPNIWANFDKVRLSTTVMYMNTFDVEDMLNILYILTIIYRKDPMNVYLVIPFIENSTQDRIEYKNSTESIATIDTLSKLIGERAQVVTFDLHNKQTGLFFHNLHDLSILKPLWELFLDDLDEICCPVFPDEGASKQIAPLLGIKDYIQFSKKRCGAKRELRLVNTSGDIKNIDYVIIDDMVRSGGTVNVVTEYLLNHGAKRVFAIFAHAPIERVAISNLSKCTKVYTSDSCGNIVPKEWVKINVHEHVMNWIEKRQR